MKLAPKLAVVTGGTKRLGAAIAARLAGAGYDLALHSHSASEPEPALMAAIEAAGARAHVFTADLGDEGDVESLVPAVAAYFGRSPTCLVNSASRFGEDRWEDVTFSSLVEHFKINAATPAVLAGALAAGLGADERGVVVNILDQRIISPPDDQAGYTASKQALAGITQAQARAFAPRVRVCGVAPGLTLPTADYSEEQMKRLAALMPLEVLPTPTQIADAVLYLVGAEATTGQVIFVDGGASLRSFARDFVKLALD